MYSSIHIAGLMTAVLFGLVSGRVVEQRATSDICGEKGYDRGNGNYYYDSGNKIKKYAACSAKCAADSTCQSFGIGEACMLFNIPLENNFDAAKKSKDTYYDKACLSSSTSSSSSPTTASSTTRSSATPATTSSAKLVSTTSTVPTTTSMPTTTSSSRVASSSSTSSASSTSTLAIPSGCPAPAQVELTDLSWFNSTHNLDCPTPNYPAGSQVCFDSTHVCPDAYDGVANGTQVCSCVPFCYTGLPSYAYQPLGYGPPDNITIKLSDSAQPSCTAVMPTGFRDFEIGVGHVNCGSAADTLEFYGNSNADSGNNGSVYYNGFVYSTYSACGGTPRYGGSFPLSCTRDSGGNATCGLANGPVTLSLLALE